MAGIAVFAFATACSASTADAAQPVAAPTSLASAQEKPFLAQVVGLEWLNPLQRRDYPTEWQLLWTMGLVKPNKNDDMVRADPKSFTSVNPVAIVADVTVGMKVSTDSMRNTSPNSSFCSMKSMR